MNGAIPFDHCKPTMAGGRVQGLAFLSPSPEY